MTSSTNKRIGRKTALGGAITAAVLAATALFVQPWEGRELKPYRDIVGVLTVCDGHTGRDIEAGKSYTHAECDAWLKTDLATAYRSVERCITVPLTVNQASAFTSAAFNIGPSVVCGSTLQRLANAGDVRGACNQLPRWRYAGGKVVRGLERRRAAERELCLKS